MPEPLMLYGRDARVAATIPIVLTIPGEASLAISVPVEVTGVDPKKGRLNLAADVGSTTLRDAVNRAEERRFQSPGRRPDDVLVEGLRKAAEQRVGEGHLTWADVAAACDWYRANGQPDGQRVRRELGIRDATKTHVRMHTATVLAHAIGVDPAELGF